MLFSKVEVDAGFKFLTFLAQLRATFRRTEIPPSIAIRKNTRGPILFQCCRVVFNKETNCLEFPKREFVYARGCIRIPKWKEEEKAEYENTAVSLEEDEESNLTG